MTTSATSKPLGELLDGASWDEASAEALIKGVAAAPPQTADPDAWRVLIAEDPGGDLRAALDRRLRAARAADHGLGVSPAPPERLRRLRSELKRRGLDGFLIPRSDEHQGEYVAARSERLAWVSGLTASAGMAIVLARTAAVFADGRYTLQAEAQVNGDLFERRHLTDSPPAAWIAGNLPKGGRLGYDPWLLTPNQAARFAAACEKAGGSLVPVEGNPVDAVWADQPPPPLAPVWGLDEAFAGESADDKRGRMAEGLKSDGLDAVFLSAPDSIAWLLNVRGGDVPFTPFALSFALLHADASVDWFIDPRKITPDARARTGDQVRLRDPDHLGPALDGLGKAKKVVRLDPAAAPAWAAHRLKNAGGALSRGDDPCQLAKALKNVVQMQGMRDAHVRDGAALTRCLAWLDAEAPGGALTELAVADKLEAFRGENDHFRGPSFSTISGSGPNGAIVHYRVTPETDRTLGRGELFLVDSGGQYLDGTTDVTRTVAIGAPSDEMRRRWSLVLKGHIALAEARFPAGTNGAQLDVLARQALWAAGLDYDHGTGHGVGSFLSVHEGPHRITKAANRVSLETGMVVSNEPGYYKAGAYGIRIENMVAVTDLGRPDGAERDVYGFETLTLAPLDRRLVDLGVLNDAEVDWVDAYHQRVADAVGPLVDEATRSWLEAATAPLRS